MVLGSLGGPEAEAIVVFHHSDAALHASLLCGFEPLARIGSLGRVESGVGLTAIAPFGVGVGVHAVVEEGVEFRFVPFQLTGRRHGENGLRRVLRIVEDLLLQPKLSLRIHTGGCDGEGKQQAEAKSFVFHKG